MAERETEAGSRGTAILVCAPSDRSVTCPSVGVPDDAESVNVLCVTFDGGARDRLSAMADWGIPFARTGVVTVGPGAVEPTDSDRTYTVDVIEDVEQLSELGTDVRDTLKDWTVGDTPTVVCFDSVTDLLDRADVDLTFEFLLVLTEAIRDTGATSHFHFDPAAHDGASRRTLEHVFDHVVEAGG